MTFLFMTNEREALARSVAGFSEDTPMHTVYGNDDADSLNKQILAFETAIQVDGGFFTCLENLCATMLTKEVEAQELFKAYITTLREKLKGSDLAPRLDSAIQNVLTRNSNYAQFLGVSVSPQLQSTALLSSSDGEPDPGVTVRKGGAASAAAATIDYFDEDDNFQSANGISSAPSAQKQSDEKLFSTAAVAAYPTQNTKKTQEIEDQILAITAD